LFLVGRRDQPVAPEAFVEGFQVHRANFMGWPSHGGLARLVVLPGCKRKPAQARIPTFWAACTELL
jgi:hypothetical protein